ncbi:hypothetical protein TWF730_010201 [Orbilia blumenaviensis]|uniref:F-box domain-containing protein n=1 Tax=Orbilia blumenaviensis TaxID=1796055 RepID=A0AAV9US59_9PEZI
MASITSLQTELLLQVFDDLSISDQARCAQACKRFYHIISDLKITDYDIKFDYPSFSVWRLVRCLLINPQIGERFQKLTLKFYLRGRRVPETPTLKWNWTNEEEIEIKKLCDAWNIGSTWNLIQEGISSRALLPLLLRHTTCLRNIDFGEMYDGFVYTDPSLDFNEVEALRIWNGSIAGGHMSFADYSFMKSHFFNQQDFERLSLNFVTKTSWFSETMGQTVLSLSNITEFTYWGCKTNDRWNTHDSDAREFVSRLLLLPRLEVVKIGKIRTISRRHGFYKDIPDDTRCSIKHLELIGCWFLEPDFEDFAELTHCLESFKCVIDLSESMGYEISERRVTDFFLSNNKGTLTRDRVSVTTDDRSRGRS